MNTPSLSRIPSEIATKQLPFSFLFEDRFPWGSIQLQLDVRSGIIQAANVYSDAMDWSLAPKLEQALTGIPFTLRDLQEAVRRTILDAIVCRDLCDMLEGLSL